MLGLGWTELSILFIVAILFIGPAQLPEVVRTLNRWRREVMKVKREWMDAWKDDEDLQALRRSANELRRPFSEAGGEVKSSLRDIQKRVEALKKKAQMQDDDFNDEEAHHHHHGEASDEETISDSASSGDVYDETTEQYSKVVSSDSESKSKKEKNDE